MVTRRRRDALRNGLMRMTIRYGTSMSRMADAAADGRREDAVRYSRASYRQFAAVQRLARALAGQST